MTAEANPLDPQTILAALRTMAEEARTPREVQHITARIAAVTRAFRLRRGDDGGMPANPLVLAREVDPTIRERDHLVHLSERIAAAVRRVEHGKNATLIVSMPPRAGKSTTGSLYTPLWILHRHPEWSIISTSFDGTLSGGWARGVRRIIEDRPDLGITLAADAGAGTRWETADGGGLYATSTRGRITGRGARVLLIDDPVKDFVDAHSQVNRDALWDWWLTTAYPRLEPPYLVIVLMTRWHEDDFVGRLLSDETEGDPTLWEQVVFPAIADHADVLGREEGEPLLSPVVEETPEEAVERWADVKTTVGSYAWASMFQQRPAPAKGAIFDSDWWRFWTTDPGRASTDGRTVLLDPGNLTGGRWLDSWDAAFKATADTDWVVGQRWVRSGPNRYLVAQQRGRWSFTATLSAMRRWADGGGPYGKRVHRRLVEEKANGPAIIDVLKDEFAGLIPVTSPIGKEGRARAITPECESGHVYLPHPSDPGNEWVKDLLSELRDFPHAANDDQVDSLTQALSDLRDEGVAALTTATGRLIDRRIATAAQTTSRRIAR